jgi:uncharacterized protein YeeX (DUF496 family)
MSDLSEFPDSLSKYQKIQQIFEESNRENEKDLNFQIHRAENEIEQIKQKWTLFFIDLANDNTRSLSPEQIRTLQENLRSDFHNMVDHYLYKIHDTQKQNELYRDTWSFFINTDSQIDISVQKAEQNYRKEIHEQKIATINAYGELAKNLGVNIVVLVLGILSAVLGQKIL